MRRAVLVLAMLLAPPAIASPCGSDGGGDDGGDSDSGGGGGGGSYTASESAPACVEVSSVVGRAQCTGFATWDTAGWPRMQFAIGTSFHVFDTAGLSFSGTADHGDVVVSYDIPGKQLGGEPDRGAGGTLDVRATGTIGEHLYAGAEVAIGAASLSDVDRMTAPSGVTLDPGSALYLAGGAVGGIALHAGNLTVRAETLLGGRSLALTVTSYHPTCEQAYQSLWDHQLVIEPRLRAEWWTSPWVTVGAYVGADALRDRDLSGGLYLQGHLRAFQ